MKTKILGSIILAGLTLTLVFFAYNNQKNLDNNSFLFGTYKIQNNENEKNCNLNISLQKDNNNLKYELSVLKQDEKGNFLNDTRNMQGDAIYDSNNKILSLMWINFWNDEMNQNKLEIIYNDKNQTLEFQNEWNNMNSFTVIPECSLKFIVLKK